MDILAQLVSYHVQRRRPTDVREGGLGLRSTGGWK